jgi:glycosyltransferase involved in cell wall biosynthesis
MDVSVCIATYNGAKYIELQLNSIINQLDNFDEIIIVDDFSQDDTLKIIKSYNDFRIKIFQNEVNKGHVFSFGRAISLSTKDIIFMCDQDDIWKNNRLILMKEKLINSSALLLSSNSEFINSSGSKINFIIDGVETKNSFKYFNNILDIFKGKTNYYGCTSAFKTELKKTILPIPTYVESHDLWIAMAANLIKSNIHCNEVTLQRRIHGLNASVVKRNLLLKFKSRIIFFISLIELIFRKFKN